MIHNDPLARFGRVVVVNGLLDVSQAWLNVFPFQELFSAAGNAQVLVE